MGSNREAPDRGLDLSAIPSGEGVDLHYQDIGRQTLGEGDSLALETASGKAPYERIVEWIVPDTRRDDGVYVSQGERDSDPEKYRDAAWDAVRFRNPLDFPMTTAPAIVVAGGRFNGQRLSYWVNPGEETTLHVTKALSVRTRSVEQEVESSREIVWVGGSQYHKTAVQGELRANNHRKEPARWSSAAASRASWCRPTSRPSRRCSRRAFTRSTSETNSSGALRSSLATRPNSPTATRCWYGIDDSPWGKKRQSSSCWPSSSGRSPRGIEPVACRRGLGSLQSAGVVPSCLRPGQAALQNRASPFRLPCGARRRLQGCRRDASVLCSCAGPEGL